jgi:ferredoxin-type protein NapF
MTGRKRLRRLFVQLACFAAASVLLWPMPSWNGAAGFVARSSPFVAVCSSAALRSMGLGTGIGWIFAVIALFRRRWFCRYTCPTGLLLEGAARVGLQKTSWWNRCPPLGQYAALLTILGAAVGYPMLLWMDPLSIFSSAFDVRTAGDFISGVLAGLLLGILILLSLASGGLWCARVCPLGGMQDVLASAKSWIESALKGRLKVPAPAPERGTRLLLARRGVLLGVAGLGTGLWAKQIGAARGEDAPLRPPGAAPENRFAGLCIRCGNCVRVCPSRIIHPDTGQAGVAGLLAPVIRYEKRYCLEDCDACTQVCPSGALQVLDLNRKRLYVIGEALVDGSICLLALGKKDCDACARSCPFDAVRIYWDEELYVAYPIVDAGKCNGCGACEVACPTNDIKAIRVWRVAD